MSLAFRARKDHPGVTTTNLGFIAGGSGQETDSTTVTILDELTEEECREYDVSQRTLSRFISDYLQFVMVRQSFDEYKGSLGEFSRIHSSGARLDNEFIANWITQELNRRLRSFFTEVRMFLDYSESRLKRQYGHGSEQVNQFKKACSEAFDNSFAYRFLFNLRNYGQHVDVPMRNLSMKSSLDRNDEVQHRLAIQVDREELLANFQWRADVLTTLREMPERFDLAPYLDELMEHLERIHVALVAAELPTTKRAADYLRRLAAPVRDKGSPCVFLEVPEEMNHNIQIKTTWIPVYLADVIVRLPDPQLLKAEYMRLELDITFTESP